MSSLLVAVISCLAIIIATTASGLIVKELEGWFDIIPNLLLKVARRRLPSHLRVELYEEWSAELHIALHAASTRPISRLFLGVRYATGLLWAARRVGRELSATSRETDDLTVDQLARFEIFAADTTPTEYHFALVREGSMSRRQHLIRVPRSTADNLPAMLVLLIASLEDPADPYELRRLLLIK
ncbi:hypothetical protein [Polymorphospora lycopeni]|uniref:Uncharacterized protein n=1 Tax=Polymorphospora lycopeni TaxID=3140240 RepID=A0ABV5CW07_9ACTN